VPSASGTSAAASSSSPASGSAPAALSTGTSSVPPSLRSCVLHLTRGVPPRLVDRATYQGTPAYVIATGSRVWVVGLGCTATNPHQITSASLAS
jgi:hypothetical protein